jgi:N-acetylglucosaminyldiphosphoundecaprenol N-acetyl-beta-D-mannosaminyltransferase
MNNNDFDSDGNLYDSYKEEQDLILEYNQVKLDDVNVVNILGVGIDNVSRAQAVVKVMDMIKEGGVYHIVPMNPYKLMRTKSSSDLSVLINKADMHLPSGGGLMWAGRKLKKPFKEQVLLLSFMMDIVRIAEIKEYPIFIVGGKPEVTEMAFFNIKKSFPHIRIVGRHGGYFNTEREKAVVEAMRKSEARIFFVGFGFPKEDRWIQKIRKDFNNGVFISIGGSIDIISGSTKKAPAYFMERGLDWFYRIITRPWRIDRVFRTLMFFIRLTIKGFSASKTR